MVDFSTIFPHIGPFFMVLSRIGGLFAFAPVLSSTSIPTKLKGLLAVSLSVAVYTCLLPDFAARGELDGPSSILGMISSMGFEILVGTVIGYLASVPTTAVQLGGLEIGEQMGLGFARSYNPSIDDEADVIGQLLFYLALIAFIASGGIEIIFMTTVDTFHFIPVGGYRVDSNLISLIVGMLTSAIELGIRVSAPVLCLIFLETFALGFMNKTAPAFNILSLGFPIRIILGFLTLIGAIGAISDGVFDDINHSLYLIFHFFHHAALLTAGG